MHENALSDSVMAYASEESVFVAPKRSQTNKLLSVYQYPTLTVLIDDRECFPDSMAFQLNPNLACKVFNDARAAIDWLHLAHMRSVDNEPIRVGYDEQTESFERRSATIDLDLIYRNVMNRQRFEDAANDWNGVLPGDSESALQKNIADRTGR
jgi:hypothetical protein